MSRENNDGKKKTNGFGEADQEYIPDLAVLDSGPRDLTDPNWVVKDRRFKEYGTKRPKYY